MEVLGQSATGGKVIPDVKELEDVLARRRRVQSIAFTAGQRLLVLPAGCLLP